MILFDALRVHSISLFWQINGSPNDDVDVLRKRNAKGKSKSASKEDGEESNRPRNLVDEIAAGNPVQIRAIGVEGKSRHDGRTGRQRLFDKSLAVLQVQHQLLGIVWIHQSDLLHTAGTEHKAFLLFELPSKGLAIDRRTARPSVNLPQKGNAKHGARHEAFRPSEESRHPSQTIVEAEDGVGQDVVGFKGADGGPAQLRQRRQLVGVLHDRFEGKVGFRPLEQRVADAFARRARKAARQQQGQGAGANKDHPRRRISEQDQCHDGINQESHPAQPEGYGEGVEQPAALGGGLDRPLTPRRRWSFALRFDVGMRLEDGIAQTYVALGAEGAGT